MNFQPKHYVQDLRRYYKMPSVQSSLTLVLSLFVMTIFIVFALKPTLVSITALQKTIKESQKTSEQLKTKVKNLQVASAQLDKLKPVLPKLNANITTTGAMYAPLTQTIEAVALQSNAEIESSSLGSTLLYSKLVSPFLPSKDQNVIALPYSVQVNGNFASLTQFLNTLLTMERILSIESLTMIPQAGQDESKFPLSINISGNAYYLAEEAQLNKILELKAK